MSQQQLDNDLIHAAETGDLNGIERALKSGADIHAKNDAALRWAAEVGHLAVVDLLLKSGADIHAKNDAAFLWASETGHLDLVDLLLKSGADVHADDDQALRMAANYGHTAVVIVLLKNGADVHVKNGEALQYAAINNYPEVLNRLTQAGADLTALHQVILNKKQITDILKQHAATAYRGIEAVMILKDESRFDVLRHLHPDLKPKQIREELAMLEALGLDAAQMATMWTSSHGVAPMTPEIGVSA